MVFSLITILLASFLIYGLLIWAFVGWGSLATRFLRIELPDSQLIFAQIWLGWAIGLLLLQLLNLVMPINWIATSLVVIGGGVAWWVSGHKVPDVLGCLSHGQRFWIFASVALLLMIWLTTQSMRQIQNYDTGLYHLQSIKWLNEYAIIPGLGNLHSRLAFNQSFFVFPAFLNAYPFFSHGHTLANAFLYLLIALEGFYLLIFQRGERSLSRFAAIFLLPFIFGLSLRESPASAAPDTASAILHLVIWLQFVRLIEEPLTNSTMTRSRIFIIIILAATSITMKLSLLGFTIGLGVVFLIFDGLSGFKMLQTCLPYLSRLVWLPILIFLVWIGRGYLFSGYPLYPVAFGGIDVDWLIPLESVKYEAHTIYLWARHRSLDELQSGWVWGWFRGLSRMWAVYPVLATLLMAGLYGVFAWITRRKLRNVEANYSESYAMRWSVVAAVTIPILLGLLYWLFTAPDPRFVRSLFGLLPILMAYVLLWRLEKAKIGRFYWNHMLAMVIVNLMVIVAFVLDAPRLLPIPTAFAPIPTSEIAIHVLPTGLTVLAPVDDDRCWDADLPCTPYVNEQLRLRGSTFQQGFAVNPPP